MLPSNDIYPKASKLTGLGNAIYEYNCVNYISYRIQKMSVHILIYKEIKHWSNTKREDKSAVMGRVL